MTRFIEFEDWADQNEEALYICYTESTKTDNKHLVHYQLFTIQNNLKDEWASFAKFLTTDKEAKEDFDAFLWAEYEVAMRSESNYDAYDAWKDQQIE